MRWLMALLLFAGIALAGSEGEYFPWPNFVGLGMLVAVALLARREETKGRIRA